VLDLEKRKRKKKEKEIQKSGVKPVWDTIGTLHFQKKFKNPV
jgi:hypothetical protein